MGRVAIRTDSSSLIGSGHVMRCLVLADALARYGNEVRFLSRALPGDLTANVEARGFSMERLLFSGNTATQWQEDLAATQRAITAWGDVDWLVVDHYGLDARWESSMRGLVPHLMVIDDLADRRHDCDLLLDHNCGAEQGRRYATLVNGSCRQLMGPEYALLSPIFDSVAGRRRDERPGVVRRILVSFGGADPSDETTKAIRALVSLGRPDLSVDVAVGGSNPRWEEITALCSAHPNIHCHHGVSNMGELLAAADLAIGGGGVSLLERCVFSLPAIIESLAPNQMPGCLALAQRGAALYLGGASQTTAELIGIAVQAMLCSPELVHHLSVQAGEVVDGRGVERVVRTMLERPIVLRPAEAADCETILQWRNHELTRRFAGNSSQIELDTHRQWFAAVLADGDRHLLVAEDGIGSVGVVRYDVNGDTATVSVFLDPRRHGQGLGSQLIEAGDAWLRARRASVRKVIAEIHSENTASMRAFARAGYVIEWHRLVHELAGS